MNRCPDCASPLAAGAARCTYCGQQVRAIAVTGSEPEATARPTKDCPFCGESILAVAIKCRYCRSDLQPASGPRQVEAGAAGPGPWDRLPFRNRAESLAVISAIAGAIFGAYIYVRLAQMVKELGPFLNIVSPDLNLVTFPGIVSGATFFATQLALSVNVTVGGPFKGLNGYVVILELAVTATGTLGYYIGSWLGDIYGGIIGWLAGCLIGMAICLPVYLKRRKERLGVR